MTWTRDMFQGVYASNTLPIEIYKRPCALVVNTDEAHEPGSHWTAIYLDQHGNGDYFDSYGLCPLSKHTLDFLDRNTHHWTFNTRQLQHSITTMCGAYCVFYLMYRCRYKKSMTETIAMMFPDLSSPPLTNDINVQQSLKKRFGLFIPLVELDFVMQRYVDLYKN